MLVLVLAFGCAGSSGGGGGGDVADFVLNLQPIVAERNQADLFDELDKIDLVLDPRLGEPRRVELVGWESGSAEITDLPALDETSIVVEGYLGGQLAIWGRTEPFTADTGEVEAQVFVAENDAAAWFESLPEGLWRPVLAALGDGQFLLAGGLANDRAGAVGKGQDVIYELTLAPPVLSFEEIGTLPTYLNGGAGEQTNRFGATFTPLTVSGTDEGKVLLVGGSDRHPYIDDSTGVSQAVSLFDPSTGEWEELGDAKALSTPRALHVAVENSQGNVVVWGGWVYQGTANAIGWANTVEVYDRANQSFAVVGTATVGELDAAVADLGTDGTLLCGGITSSTYGDRGTGPVTPVSTCVTVSPDGSEIDDSVRELPKPLAAHGMATLDDGRVLLAGGVTADSVTWASQDYLPAIDNAYVYDPRSGEWAAVGNLKVARAGHRMARLPDGRVLVAGGATNYHPVYGTNDAVSCLEVFDPATASFTSIDACTANDEAGGLPGPSFQPELVVDPVRGALVVGGLDSSRSAQSSVSVFVSASE
ncbi:MAG: Kelch repeat-containing protein [Myxococcota bacterium]